MGKTKFKVGDISRPIEGRKQSNDYKITNLKELIVTRVNVGAYKDCFDAKIIEGRADSSYYSSKSKGNIISLYSDAFELISKHDDYEIY